MPVLSEKLPNELRTHISRKFGNNAWTIDELLEIFKEELQAKERCATKKSVNSDDDRFTAAGLISQSSRANGGSCVYCTGYRR